MCWKFLVNCCIEEVVFTVYEDVSGDYKMFKKHVVVILNLLFVYVGLQKEMVALSTMEAVTSQLSASE